jgi:hypothetical protein
MDEEQRKKFDEAASRQMAIHLLKELAGLHKEGILTDEEFESKKAELLAKL